MTMTISVKVRAHGGKLAMTSADGSVETVSLEPFESHVFHSLGKVTLTAEELSPRGTQENPRPFEGEAVPGAAENDMLLGKGDEIHGDGA